MRHRVSVTGVGRNIATSSSGGERGAATAGAIGMTRFTESQRFEVSTFDPVTFAAVGSSSCVYIAYRLLE
jgi:hypothetical protein